MTFESFDGLGIVPPAVTHPHTDHAVVAYPRWLLLITECDWAIRASSSSLYNIQLMHIRILPTILVSQHSLVCIKLVVYVGPSVMALYTHVGSIPVSGTYYAQRL